MAEPELDTHPDISIRVELVGKERSPVLIVDNLVDRPEALIEYAASDGRLGPPTDMYPGLRAPAPRSYFKVLQKGLTAALNSAHALPDLEIHSAISYLCIVTTPREKMQPVQCMPHIDGDAPNNFSSVHYLCADTYDGTSMYRHRRTGYEIITDYRHAHFRSVLDRELRETPWTVQDYITGDTEMFEHIASFKVAFNRAIFYRSNALHSADIGADFPFDPDPRTGRFSVNSRLHMRPKGFQANPWPSHAGG
jgi:Family of unknown function (DUF6445)